MRRLTKIERDVIREYLIAVRADYPNITRKELAEQRELAAQILITNDIEPNVKSAQQILNPYESVIDTTTADSRPRPRLAKPLPRKRVKLARKDRIHD